MQISNTHKVGILVQNPLFKEFVITQRRWDTPFNHTSEVEIEPTYPTAHELQAGDPSGEPDPRRNHRDQRGDCPPRRRSPGSLSYLTSKLALVRVIEYLAAENPNVVSVALHPGIVETVMFGKFGADPAQLPMDEVNLPADFTLWLSSKEAAFLSGRYVFANWDVEELKAKAQDIQSGILLTAGIQGWPFL
ncbi:hypothetical protein BJX70DRAFT_396363 [Aspergillus crustosus]